jgi:fused signal recognition particle receptor
MFNFLKEKIKKIYGSVTKHFTSLFSRTTLDDEFLKELSMLLITADTGVATTNDIIENLNKSITDTTITTLDQAKHALEKLLTEKLAVPAAHDPLPEVVVMVGINGSGKTSFIAKYANLLKKQGKRVLVVAGDTFRAAATEQLDVWAGRIGVSIFIGKEGQDPSSVIFDACKKFVDDGFDHIIIDTAGRLQTKSNLMRELEKIKKIIVKQLPGRLISTWLTIDAMLGQNSLQQAQLFHEATQVSGLILTKLDGTGKGGVVFAITQKLQLPIVYITFGESLDDIKPFDAPSYVKDLLFE